MVGKSGQPQGLISVLLDQTAEFGDRHDAAMDLSDYGGEAVEAALARVANDPTEDTDLSAEAADSLREINRRKSGQLA